MSMEKSPEERLAEVVRADGRYPLEAFALLHDGLERAVRGVYGEKSESKGTHHVSGAQLSWALRDEAVERWGLLAPRVLAKWNIRATLDFGNMVYLLVDNELMSKTDQDSLEDFRDVFAFSDAFGPETVFGGGP